MSKGRARTLVIFVVGALIGAGAGFVVAKRGIPLYGDGVEWGVGVFTASSPIESFKPGKIKNPVLTIKDITDVDAEFVADPFMVKENGTWYLFVEVLNRADDKGDLAVATSKDGMSFKYQKLVLNEKFHLSYPHVIKWEGQWYMVPETNEDKSIRLYKATKFPYKWTLHKKLVTGAPFVDSSLLQHDGKWWMWTSIVGDDVLMLYYADRLDGTWVRHPKDPLILGNAETARPGGRVIKWGSRIIRYAQDCYPVYGTGIRAFEVTTLTTTDYAEKLANKNYIVGPTGKGWNALGMHQVDAHKIGPHKWIAAVDGYWAAPRYGLKH